MISPLSAPPGTVVVCVDGSPAPKSDASMVIPSPVWVREMAHYTVQAWSLHPDGQPRVFLSEVPRRGKQDWGYHPVRFRLPVTPEGLLSVPSEAPADLDRRTAPVSPRKRVRA